MCIKKLIAKELRLNNFTIYSTTVSVLHIVTDICEKVLFCHLKCESEIDELLAPCGSRD